VSGSKRESLGLNALANSVVDVEVHKIPSDREPDQAQAGKRQSRIVQFGPDPPVGHAPASKCAHAGQDRATRAQHTRIPKKTIQGARHSLRQNRGPCQNSQPAPKKQAKMMQTNLTPSRSLRSRDSDSADGHMFANQRSDWPQHQRQDHHTQTEDQVGVMKYLFSQKPTLWKINTASLTGTATVHSVRLKPT